MHSAILELQPAVRQMDGQTDGQKDRQTDNAK